jgi:hypothetical protein
MGGSSTGIVYAKGTETTIVKANPENENDFMYNISAEAFEDSNTLPLRDSLILNSDGRFFRVLSSDTSTRIVSAVLLAVSGTGGGGGGGGGPIITYSDRAKIQKRDPESSYLINGKEASIEVYAISGKDIDGSVLDSRLTIYWTLSEKLETGVLSQYA